MKRKILGSLSLAMVLILSGCGKHNSNSIVESTTAIKSDEYAAMLPFKSSSSRYIHSSLNTDLRENMVIGSGLMELSKQYFSPKQYAYREGEFLTYDALDATRADRVGLLGRTSEKNPNGMNLPIDTEIETNHGIKKISATDVLLIDIYEIDWYDDKDLGGISLAIVLNDKIGNSEKPDIVSDEKLRAYGEEVGRKTVNYLRKTHPEIKSKMPIYVALYKQSGVNTTVPGTFIEEANFVSKTNGTFTKLNEDWAVFPSEKADKLDRNSNTLFQQFASEIKKFFPEDTSVIGTGKFENGYLCSLSIDIGMYAKTWSEANAMIQKVNSSLSIFNDKNVELKVTMKSNGNLIAAIEREKGSTNTTVIQLQD